MNSVLLKTAEKGKKVKGKILKLMWSRWVLVTNYYSSSVFLAIRVNFGTNFFYFVINENDLLFIFYYFFFWLKNLYYIMTLFRNLFIILIAT